MEIEEEGVVQDQSQTDDTLVHAEEDREEQPTQEESTMVPTDDVATKDLEITIVLIVHDDENGEA